MAQSKNKKDAGTISTRLTKVENGILKAIINTEGFTQSDAIRYAIRFVGRAYGLLPTIDCPNCESQKVEQTADDLMVCSKCGQEFGK